jgi:predicted nuclease of restriction endonuclease-like RecB superfamily
MLTREHAIVAYDGARAIPDRLTQKKHGHYAGYAQRMCEIYAQGVGQTRRQLHREVQAVFALDPDCPPRRIDAFCKLLDEASDYDRDSAGAAAKLRQQVFRAAASLHPLVSSADPWFEHEESLAKQRIAESLGLTWDEIDRRLFADIIELHRLREFRGYDDPVQLLARYNVAQTQVALFDATQMTVWATADFKAILKYAKLARLMHTITRLDDGQYRFDFDGPASLFAQTHRYGAAMARFLPGLLGCRGWKMKAALKPPRWFRPVWLRLDSESGLRSPAHTPDDFDSQLEQNFFERWGDEPRDGWRLSRESEILHSGQSVFTPDFVLTHESGQQALLEIVGFWTPEYLKHKQQTLQKFRERRILLAVAESASHHFDSSAADMFTFKTAIKPQAVLERLAARTAGPAGASSTSTSVPPPQTA